METGTFIFRAIQNQRQIRYNVSFWELLLCNSTSDCLETAWVSSWSSGLSIWIEIVLWKMGVLFLKLSKITDRRGGIWDLECFHFVIQHQIVLKLLECHLGVVDCQSELKIVLWKQGVSFLELSKIKDRSGIMWFGELVLCNSTSDCLETAWVSSWGSGLSIWIEIVLWKQGVFFLELSKIKDRSGIMWDLESLYYVIQHQIVLKLLECHLGVVDCQSELKLFCGNREFPF